MILLRCCESNTSVHEIINWKVTVNVWKWVLKYIERVQERLYRCIKYSISTRHLSNPLYLLFLDFRKSRTRTCQTNLKNQLRINIHVWVICMKRTLAYWRPPTGQFHFLSELWKNLHLNFRWNMFISWEPKDEYIFWPAMITVTGNNEF